MEPCENTFFFLTDMYIVGVIYHVSTDQITRRLMIQG